MQTSDLSEVLAAENKGQVSPWNKASFEESLAREHVCRVLINKGESQSDLIAFYVICPIVDEMHILNLLVAKTYQGQGVGHFLMQSIVDVSQQNTQIKRIFLEVRASNTIAQNLYDKWQFKQLSLRKDYYRTASKAREDALILFREL